MRCGGSPRLGSRGSALIRPRLRQKARKIRRSASLISNSGCHWMPRQKAVTGVFDALDDTVLGDGIDDEARSRSLDRLMMGAVDAELVYSRDAVQQSARNHLHGMPGLVPRVRLTVRQAIASRPGCAGFNVPPSADIPTIAGRRRSRAPAFGGRAHPARAASSKAVRRSLVLTLGCRVAAPNNAGSTSKAAAGDDQSIDRRDSRGGIGIMRQQNRQPAGIAHRLAIILANRIPRKFE